MIVAYSRISTDLQSEANQKGMLEAVALRYGLTIDSFVIEQISSGRKDRVIFGLMNELNDGDTLITTEMSRLARSPLELLNFAEQFKTRNIRVIFGRENIQLNSGSPMDDFIYTMLAAVMQFERAITRQRTREALAAKKLRGEAIGRRSTVLCYKTDIIAMRNKGIADKEIAVRLGVSPSAISRMNAKERHTQCLTA